MNEQRLNHALFRCPLVAILRGIEPHEAAEIGRALVEAGIRILEVPLNSPEPLDSIARLIEALPDDVVVGAGTVLSLGEVRKLADVGGQLVVSPNCDASVISAARERGMACLPGFVTPSEAFVALAAGASGLKLFPADAYGPGYLRALKAVIPGAIPVLPVGGISPANLKPWVDAGAAGFGTGSGLYRPGMNAKEVGQIAREYIGAVHSAGLIR